MTVHHIDSAGSDNTDESDGDDMVSLPQADPYERRYLRLVKRCLALQQHSDMLLNRIYQSKHASKRCKRDIELLVERLDSHDDTFRLMQLANKITMNMKSRQVLKPQGPSKQAEKQNATGPKKQATKRKSKAEKPEKDPNAPKKPCNAFFQFCQEQRPLVIAETNSEDGIEPSKQEVTRRLAHRWRSLTHEEKRVYVAMFEKSKEKYVEQMSQYNTIKKENDSQQ